MKGGASEEVVKNKSGNILCFLVLIVDAYVCAQSKSIKV